jgi:protein-tyrosine sulfotransferase
MARDPIFILGMVPRTGTNFLSTLVRVHPDCAAPAPIWEDHLLHHADSIISYVQSVSQHWTRAGSVDDLADQLRHSLGDGLISFLSLRAGGKRLVTKSPSVRNLDSFFQLFPAARLLLLVRDGRSVVESTVVAFDWNYDDAIRHWANAARIVLRFDREHGESNTNNRSRYLIVRYEELCLNLEREMRRILAFLEMNIDTYDFQKAANLPVLGSCEVRKGGSNEIHWDAVVKTADFSPLHRYDRWSRAVHERFNWIAGAWQTELGYEVTHFEGNRFLWSTWNRLLDLRRAASSWWRTT